VLLNEFVNLYGGLNEEDFLLHFDHPFLLQEAGDDIDGARREVFLLQAEDGTPLVVGRGARCHIRVRDSLVSTRHAELTRQDGTWQLTDTGSTNKTTVMGQELVPNAPRTLADGDKLSFGLKSHFLFLAADTVRTQLPGRNAPPGEDDNALTSLLETQIGDYLDEPTELGPEAAPEPSREEQTEPLTHQAMSHDATKTLVPGEHKEDENDLISAIIKSAPKASGRVRRMIASTEILGELLLFCDAHDPVAVRSGKRIVVGRSSSAQLTLPSKEVSRAHAEFERRPNGVYVRDLDSANGTFLGKIKVRGGWLRVPPGTTVTVSSYRIMVGRGQDEDSAELALPSSGLQGFEDADLTESTAFDLAKESLSDLIHQIEEEQATGVLRITSGTLRGQITFQDGAPHQAGTSEGDAAEAAVRKLIRLEAGTCLYSLGGKIGRKTMAHSFSEIILEEFLTNG
jgi:pSer/pThr/pTyr-binding forkhead associated (FHA) protein